MAMELLSRLPYDHPYRWDGTKFGSGKLWRPSDLGADLALWLDAEDTDSITLNGSTVSQWSDKSGNGNNVTQATASAQPAYTAGAVTFDGVNDALIAATSILTNNFTGTLTMMSVSSFLSGESGYLYGAVDTTGSAFYQSITQMTLANTLSGAASNLVNHNFTLPSMNIAGAVYNNTIVNYSFNGNITNLAGTYNFAAPTTEFTLGNRRNGTSAATYWQGSHHELIVTNTALTVADRQKLEGYLAWKWNLVGNLPADHPYKTQPPFVIDPEAQKYLRAVEAADGEPLEEGVRLAVNDFVVGCKEDGIWNAIKASCILAGARTLGGALVPLTGAAPTNFNFVAGDYDRATGLVGDGSTKYLDSNRANDADPQNSNHNAVFASFVGTYDATGRAYIADTGINISGMNAIVQNSATGLFTRNRSATGTSTSLIPSTGLIACSRSGATSYVLRNNQQNTTINVTSESPTSANVLLYRRGDVTNPAYTDARLAFYSIGESIDLAKLDARVSTLITQIGAAV
jgi:hypothetical protein